MKFKILILSFTILHFYACKEQNKEAMKDAYINEVSVDTINSSKSITSNPCLDCDLIYKNFPKDSSGFEKLFGYPNGLREAVSHDDIGLFFNCLKDCYNEGKLVEAIKLSSLIKFDADAPTYLRVGLTNFLQENSDIMNAIYNNTECVVFNKHINFLFQGLENSKSIKELTNMLSTLKLDEECKRKSIKDIPKMISHEH